MWSARTLARTGVVPVESLCEYTNIRVRSRERFLRKTAKCGRFAGGNRWKRIAVDAEKSPVEPSSGGENRREREGQDLTDIQR